MCACMRPKIFHVEPFKEKNGQNQLAKKWKLVTIVNKLVYNLFRGRIQPAYIGVKYSIY